MIIPDTSIWIEFFKNHEPYSTRLRQILDDRKAYSFEPIFGELLQGVRDDREKMIIEADWNHLPRANSADLLVKAGIHSFENHCFSKGVGLIDCCLIVAAIEHKCRIWTLDKKLLLYLDAKLVFLPSEAS